jgi:hypothetical protein
VNTIIIEIFGGKIPTTVALLNSLKTN